ncbi:hypothetical protein C5708_14210 [Caulobacter sp. CCUG 60055]|uniref:hypothetical protein n=1 Tax=Caulobacter sp. CCUG 60055 TaxID=2100090 RepID=UPI001FA7553E|nr:hypothetical protein [Caulobacter sp. CCUG 60055]MCI3181404.1 hypothetical protein [Caulobacter sp. CCUG 60055]
MHRFQTFVRESYAFEFPAGAGPFTTTRRPMTQNEELVLIAIDRGRLALARGFELEAARLVRRGLLTRRGGAFAITGPGRQALSDAASLRAMTTNDA